MKIKIAITEDNKIIAQSFVEKLSLFSTELEIKFIAKNGVELLNKLKSNRDIDVILMDIEMPEMDGIQATYEVKNLYPQIKILILTVFDDDDKIFKAIQNGASGYLLKEESPEAIFNSIKIIMEGGATMSPSIASKILSIMRKAEIKSEEDKSNEKIKTETFDLSQREIEVLEKLKQGKDYKKIADELFISPSTVRKHLENIYLKLHVHNKMQAVQKAMEHKIIK
ncbi:MAG: response regulator transcription factor [Ignavibacteria bacterium]|jgi:DNA-binding NarL/FixJ family response regulator|nr:response regulator transcription factor [Ignavibacteria bacterium]MDH7528246.1 response regulator transcription factor [Ignavibacteria bacterium]NPV12596.1 response regulator transcription factor [Ignavibacteria bacterium]